MTNERAIELLNRISDSQFDGIHGDERREALEMAIRAMEEPKTAGSGSVDLEQPEIKTDRTTGDCINRQQAIKALNNTLAKYVPYLHGYTECIPLECAVAIQTLPHIHEAKTCGGCHFEKHGSRACDHCSRMYMDRYEVRNDDN